ncbi:MAG: DegT/DnrJ/EryC1/StrS family aminotransferase [Litorilinea sp.]
MSIYATLNVRTIVNATGTFTRLGGSIMAPEVMQAMTEASKEFVCLEDLQHAAGKIIAEITGAEAAYVVSGAYAGLVLAVAACMAGLDPIKMDQLPDATGMRHEVLMDSRQRNHYDHAVEAAGGKIVEVGGAAGATLDDLAAAVNPRTLAILFVPEMAGSRLELAETVEFAQAHGLRVIVDGAGKLGNPDNLRAFIAAGADLTVFSGGKFIRGPQASGFICGARALISSVAWQHMDMDITPEVWTAPRELVDASIMPFVPRQGIGRGYKAGKEEIVGLLTALRRYVARDHAAERARWESDLHAIVDGLAQTPHVQAEFLPVGTLRRSVPHARVRIDTQATGLSGNDFILALKQGEPSIHPLERELAEGAIIINPFCLQTGDAETIVRRIQEIVA